MREQSSCSLNITMPYTVNIHFPRVEHRTQLSSDTLIHLHLQPTPSQNATNPRLFLSNNLNHHKNPVLQHTDSKAR
ncbi:Uncharacterized protein HZ326_20103 [Fusarium oxysporum f. sp. albedinis]|nr:Uncharacterized protein HZ326_20103 [Fusarium oxysporum f. sp. albedinis]